jgi:hypothetical protein
VGRGGGGIVLVVLAVLHNGHLVHRPSSSDRFPPTRTPFNAAGGAPMPLI